MKLHVHKLKGQFSFHEDFRELGKGKISGGLKPRLECYVGSSTYQLTVRGFLNRIFSLYKNGELLFESKSVWNKKYPLRSCKNALPVRLTYVLRRDFKTDIALYDDQGVCYLRTNSVGKPFDSNWTFVSEWQKSLDSQLQKDLEVFVSLKLVLNTKNR